MPPSKKKPVRRQPRKTMAPTIETNEASQSLGYLIAKMESLDRYIRDHMEKEESTTKDLYSRLDQSAKNIQQLRVWQWIIIGLMIMMSSGVPVGELLIKLIGLL